MPSSNGLLLPMIALGFALLSGCANQTDDQTKQLREFNERLQRLQSATDRLEERVGSLESVQRTQASRPMNLAPATVPSDLPLVRMSAPSELSGAPQTAESGVEEARTLIVGEGSRVEARPSNETPVTNSPPARGKGDKKNSGRTDVGSKAP